MSEKFFYKENPVSNRRVDLQKAFTNALLGDVNPNTLIQSRQIQK